MKISPQTFCLVLVLGLCACKKDYPDDIPDWLKVKIKELKKETRGTKNTCCVYVSESTMPDMSLFYSIYFSSNELTEIYHENGSAACCFHRTDAITYDCWTLIETDSCGEIGALNFIENNRIKYREIWEEEN